MATSKWRASFGPGHCRFWFGRGEDAAADVEGRRDPGAVELMEKRNTGAARQRIEGLE